MAVKNFQAQSQSPQIPVSRAILTALTLSDHGTTGAVTNQGGARFDLEQDASDYHEGRVRFEVKSVNGQGGTPTSPGAAATVTFHYAFLSESITASDAPTILPNVDATLVATLPDSNSSGAAGTRYYQTAEFVCGGRYLYIWYDRDAFAANALIDFTVKLVRV